MVESKKIFGTTLVKLFWNFAMSQYSSNLTEVKQNLISSITSLVWDVSHKWPNNLRDRSLEKLGNIKNLSNIRKDRA